MDHLRVERIDPSGMNSDESDDVLSDLIDITQIVSIIDKGTIGKLAYGTSKLTGLEWVDELINGNPTRIYEILQMNVGCFLKLCNVLRRGNYLTNSYKHRVKIEESVAIFLYTVGYNERQDMSLRGSNIQLKYINSHVRRVMRSIVKPGREMIILPDFDETHLRISTDHKFYPYFKDCGAIDSITGSAHVLANRSSAFRTRKSEVSQNVLAVCDFDIYFTFIESRWEGSVNDSTVIIDALTKADTNFLLPLMGKYYVIDSVYTNMSGFLASYRGSCYHLQDFRGTRRGPLTSMGVFNYRHSSLRNVIERCFGVLKSRFAILTENMANYILTCQCQIVIAYYCLHNFIRKYANEEPWFKDWQDPSVVPDKISAYNAFESVPNSDISQAHIRLMSQVRDAITDQLWHYTINH